MNKCSHEADKDILMQEKLQDVYDFSNATVCKAPEGCGFPAVACINDTCVSCKDNEKKIRDHYSKLMDISESEPATWKRWVKDVTFKRKVIENGETTFKNETVRRRVLDSKSLTVKDMLEEVVEDAIQLDRIGIPNFPVFTGIKLIPIPPVYVFAKNRYTGTVFYTGIVLC